MSVSIRIKDIPYESYECAILDRWCTLDLSQFLSFPNQTLYATFQLVFV